MTAISLFYFDNTFASAGTQQNIGPFHPGTVGQIVRAQVNGALSGQSSGVGPTYVVNNDLAWGLNWVPHGGAALDVLTSTPTDQWLWRHAVWQKSDLTRSWSPTTAAGEVQDTYSLFEEYQSQAIRPSADIDFWISIRSSFGTTVGPILMVGTFNLWWE